MNIHTYIFFCFLKKYKNIIIYSFVAPFKMVPIQHYALILKLDF